MNIVHVCSSKLEHTIYKHVCYFLKSWAFLVRTQPHLANEHKTVLFRSKNFGFTSTIDNFADFQSWIILRKQKLPIRSYCQQKAAILNPAFVGHCCLAKGEAVSRLLLRSPCHRPARSKKLTFPTVPSRDARLAGDIIWKQLWATGRCDIWLCGESRPRPKDDDDDDVGLSNWVSLECTSIIHY